MKRLPLLSSSPINSPAGMPSNLRNSFRLSCQKILTGGMLPRAGKSKRSTVCCGKHIFAGAYLLDALHAGGRAQAHRHVRRSEDVAGHVAHGTAADNRGMRASCAEGTPDCRAAGLVPPCQISQSSVAGTGRLLGHDVGTLRPILAGAVGPRMHFGDVADVAVPDDFAALAGARVGVSLVAHLRRDAVSGGGLLQLLRFPDGARERLLTVDMFAASHGPQRSGGMHVIGTGDQYGVDIRGLLVEHATEIFVLRNFGIEVVAGCGVLIVGIGEGDDVFGFAAGDVRTAFSARSDGGDVELFVGRLIAQVSQGWRAAEAARGHGSRQQGPKEKLPSRSSVVSHADSIIPGAAERI